MIQVFQIINPIGVIHYEAPKLIYLNTHFYYKCFQIILKYEQLYTISWKYIPKFKAIQKTIWPIFVFNFSK